jgi:hypothetical protein
MAICGQGGYDKSFFAKSKKNIPRGKTVAARLIGNTVS